MDDAATAKGGAPAAEGAPSGGIVARAVLLGERLDVRGLAGAEGGLADPLQIEAGPELWAFAFRWGAVTLIGGRPERQAALLATLRSKASRPLAQPVEEAARLVLGAAEDGIDAAGVVQLKDGSLPRLALVADALAKSAALAQQEATLAGTLDAMEPVVTTLGATGRLALSTRSLLRTVGEALAARSRAVARVQADDKPDLLWDHPELERLFARLIDEFELRERAAALDRKLTLIGEATSTLLSLVDSRRALVLEVAIVLLILIELVTTFYEKLAR